MEDLSSRVKAECLLCEIQFEAMRAENKQRELRGESLAYGEMAFSHLQSQLLERLMVVRRDYEMEQRK